MAMSLRKDTANIGVNNVMANIGVKNFASTVMILVIGASTCCVLSPADLPEFTRKVPTLPRSLKPLTTAVNTSNYGLSA